MMAAAQVPFHPGLVVAGLLGLLLSIVVLHPVLREIVNEKTRWAQLGAAMTALALLIPVVHVIFDQTQHFRAKGLTEVGSAAFKEPPMSEAAARAIRDALRPGESWATVTRFGLCGDIDLYAFYWLAFRLVPNPPDCKDPDVELFLRIDPPVDAVIIARGPDYAVVRP
jgi:hypothetical protein